RRSSPSAAASARRPRSRWRSASENRLLDFTIPSGTRSTFRASRPRQTPSRGRWSERTAECYNTNMKAGTKFALGAVLIVGSVGYLMACGIQQTGQYLHTPTALPQRVSADPSFYDLGMNVG